MISFEDSNQINKWSGWIGNGKAVRFNEKKQTLERIGGFGRIRLFFARGAAKKAEQKITLVVERELRARFHSGNRDGIQNLTVLAASVSSSSRMRKSAPALTAAIERYMVGIQRQLGQQETHYSHPENTAFFAADTSRRDPRLLGVSQQYAESHPDFVEFVLNNNLYYQMARTNPADSLTVEVDAEGTPLLPFVDNNTGDAPFDEANLYTYTRSWEETKTFLLQDGLINESDSILKEHHMTRWGLLRQDSFLWERMTPITKIDPPAKPCFQIASYHPKEKLVPGLFDDQGHTGMLLVDKDGYVYSFGFYCHPDSNFYAALMAQASAVRSPDLYEARVDLNWQSIAANDETLSHTSLPVRWNDGVLQFDCEDDDNGYPCVYKILRTWDEAKNTLPESSEKREILGLVDRIERGLAGSARATRIERLSNELFAKMLQQSIQVDPMTAKEKFDVMMERAHDLQQKTVEALRTGDWSNGALPYMLAENNCTHVSRYYFGRYGEVMLGMTKTSKIVNTRPSQPASLLPSVRQSPISRLKWAEISVKSVILGRALRTLSLVPVVSTRLLGRGRAAPGFRPKTSFLSCVRNVFKSHVSPQQVREEGMSTQFKINSRVRKVVHFFCDHPSGMLPIYK